MKFQAAGLFFSYQQALPQNVDIAQSTQELGQSPFSKIWNPTEARFEPEFVSILVYLPAIIPTLLLLAKLILPSINLRPQWMMPFVIEHESKTPHKLLARKDRATSKLFILLLVVSVVGLFSQLPNLFWRPINPQHILHLIPWLVVVSLIFVDQRETFHASVLVIFVVTLITDAIILADNQQHDCRTVISRTSSIICSTLGSISCLNMPFKAQEMISKDICPIYNESTSEFQSPENNLTPFQFATFSWMQPLILKGSSRQLNDEDVWQLSYEFQHAHLHHNFRELKGSVIRRLLRANGLDLLISTILSTVEVLAKFSLPLLLQLLLQSMENSEAPMRASITYAALTLTARLISSQCAVIGLWYSRRAYERSRGEMITMLHEKTLTRKIMNVNTQPLAPEQANSAALTDSSKSARKFWLARLWHYFKSILAFSDFKQSQAEVEAKEPASKGKILNLMRNDVYEVAQRFWEFADLFTKPLSLILSVVLVWKFIGWPSLFGVLIVIISQVIDALVFRKILKWERLSRATTDTKLQKVAQFVEAIRHLRWYGWQNAWLKDIMMARQKELYYHIITDLLMLILTVANVLGSSLFPVAVFFAYTALAGQQLRIDIAFPALQLFIMLQGSLRNVPELIKTFLRASIAVGRINDFMQEEEISESNMNLEDRWDIEIKDGSFSWPGVLEPVLKEITANFAQGLSLVCGEVASGKTALLQAILGELTRQGGTVGRPDCVIGYCSQTPWLQNMSIRDNILFSSPYEEARYRSVLEACALLPDLATFKHGDLSDIGENGIGLSGGQKARVALARSIYSGAKVLLLDDPISALDYQTSKSIVLRCLLGPLTKNRIVVLVTHRIELCRALANQVLEMSNGQLSPLDTLKLQSSLGTSQNSETDTETEIDEKGENEAVPDKFIEEEHRVHGGVRLSVYWTYVKAGKLKWWTVTIVFLSLSRFRTYAQTWFLKEWGEAYQNESSRKITGMFKDWPNPERNIRPWLIGFLLFAVAQTILVLLSEISMLTIIYTAGRQMFSDLMYRVSYATFRFYDVTPVGRLMNRMTSDINTVDGNISTHFQSIAILSISWISSLIVIASITPTFLLFSTLLTLGFVLIFMRFLPTSQSLRRLEMVSLSPLMSNFGALLDGLMTVRAFRVQYRFQARVITVTDAFQKMDHFYWTLQAWLMYRLDALSSLSTFVLTLIALFTKVSPGLTAFALIAASNFVDATHALCRQYGRLQMDFVSVERIVELLNLEQEPPGYIEPPAWWPSFSGDIVFNSVTVRYSSKDEAALRDISTRIKGGSTTAIIGRTGSGKSTLALALLATIQPEFGSIVIDGVDVSKVDKQSLRTRVTFLAQDPILFQGSMRQNLDPLNDHSNEDCTNVLQKICGKHNWTIETHIDTGGKNLSQGQRQLVGLARAVLRRSAVIILDEATASIDMQTSTEIQHILRREMAESTVITIAHRLEAVVNADYYIELSQGQVKRQGPASEILQGTLISAA